MGQVWRQPGEGLSSWSTAWSTGPSASRSAGDWSRSTKPTTTSGRGTRSSTCGRSSTGGGGRS
eukprot:2092663-Heterocapsa_arctica.AAC.1